MAFIACVLAMDGTKLMPIRNPKRVRKLLKSGNAKIIGHRPFAIQLTRESEKNVQPIEFCMDSGELYIGISIKTEKSELVSEQRTLFPNEKEYHDDQRKYRRSRRNRKRYRQPRFDNRKKAKGWFAPSIRNKRDQHIMCFKRYFDRMPISDVYVEVGQFDTQVLEAVEAGRDIPKGLDYQYGPTYGHDTLREAVFARDNYTCICCHSTIGKICTGKDKNGKLKYKAGEVILRMHHLGFKTRIGAIECRTSLQYARNAIHQ